MPRDPLLRAWTALIVLCLGSTAIAVAVGSGLSKTALTAAGAVILTLSWLKARLILNAYLGLAAAPFWRKGFEITLALYALLLLGLYLSPAI
ncbi:hypothetical protein GGD81_002323 [Rhodobium orientis]|uniref:Nitric oxide reductase F protein n=1 Tax=Rhodobium orientis TaxID=34017 RepID=A0A327JQH7_9HYPH|nr:hypothetical protein [Rhodobium orientis]MBB4303280.1 hypothetical protein [Rhodobium orientis]MBK5951621.1 hypothetical protein [Rhodobium orientis]RAI27826.1 hypothetical protein CH339_08900 [Rhodobium orientis]